jgi:sulfur-oxidizing protein SoxX
MRAALALLLLAASAPALAAGYAVVGDAIPAPLENAKGDPSRGRAIVADRSVGLCVLCHSGPFPEVSFQGDLAPPLDGAGTRWSAGQLRLRLVEPQRFAPDTIMPAYYRTEGYERIAPAYAGKPILTAGQIEDVVAYLSTLRETP